MLYFYTTLLLLFHTEILVISTPLTLKEKVQSIFDASENVNDAQILEGLSNFFQNDKKEEDLDKAIQLDKDNDSTKNKTIRNNRKLKAYMKKYNIAEFEPLSSKLGRTQNVGFFRSSFLNPGLKPFKHRRLWERKTSSVEEFKPEGWHEKRLKKFEDNRSTQSRGSVNIVVDRPWEVKCGEPNQHYNLWGTCMPDKKCDEDYRIYLGDKFCDRTYICCAYADQNTVLEHEDNEISDIEDDAGTANENDGTVNEKKLTWFKQIDPMNPRKIEFDVEKMESDIENMESVLDKIESDVEKIESKLEKRERNSETMKQIESETQNERKPQKENFKHLDYDIELGRLYY